jgi:hypothetical protein
VNWLTRIGSRYRVSGDPLRTLRRIELVAVLLGLLFCLQLALGGLRLATLSAPDPVTPAPDSLRVPAVLSPVSVAASERNEIISRPLFWSGRRPVEEVATLSEPQATAGELKGVKVVGLFGSGDRAGIIALVKGQKRRILLGDVVEGWTLKSVAPFELVVANGGRTETLALERGSVKSGPTDKSLGKSTGKKKSNGSAQGRTGQVKAYPASPAAPAGNAPGAKAAAGGTAPEVTPSKAESERTLGLGARG